MVHEYKRLANWRFTRRLPAALVIVGLLNGCSMSSGLCDAFGPSKRASIEVPQNATVEEVFACIDQETIENNDRAQLFDSGDAIRDIKTGVLETQHYGTPNTSGFRLRAEVSKQASRLDLSLRGAGAYCTDLGVDNEMARLTSDVGSCLRR